MYSMVRGRGIARNYVGVAIMNFCRIRSGFMGGGVGKREDTWLWWHGMCCVVRRPRQIPACVSLHRSVRSDPDANINYSNSNCGGYQQFPPRKQV